MSKNGRSTTSVCGIWASRMGLGRLSLAGSRLQRLRLCSACSLRAREFGFKNFELRQRPVVAVQRASGAQLQELVGGGARLSQPENGRPARAPHPPSPTYSQSERLAKNLETRFPEDTAVGYSYLPAVR